EQAKKQEQDRLASVAPSAQGAGAPDTVKPAGPAVAAAAPAETKPERSIPPDLPRQLQAELKRVGCKSGEVEGEWNASAQRGLSLFINTAGTNSDAKADSLAALAAVRGKRGGVCPLDCDRVYRASGDRCVKTPCDEGFVLG